MNNTYQTSIDIGTGHIAIVGCEIFEGKDISISHTSLTPSFGIDRGYIRDIAQCTEALKVAVKEFERKSKRKLESASFSIGGIGLASQYVRTNIILKKKESELSSQDLSDVVGKAETLFSDKYPNKKILHVIPISYKVDGRDVLGSPVGMFGSSIEAKIILVTIPEHHFDSLVSVIEAVGINIEDIVAAPLADASYSLNNDQRKQGAVLINIGSETTQVSTYEHGILTSLKVIPLGSNDITNDLALGLQIPIEEARSVKHGENNNHPKKRVEEIRNARIIDIVESVEQHLKSIRKNRLLPAGAFWTGSGSLAEGIAELGRSMLRIPSTLVRIEVQDSQKKQKKFISPKFSIAYGLCSLDGPDEISESIFSLASLKKKVRYFISQLRP